MLAYVHFVNYWNNVYCLFQRLLKFFFYGEITHWKFLKEGLIHLIRDTLDYHFFTFQWSVFF